MLISVVVVPLIKSRGAILAQKQDTVTVPYKTIYAIKHGVQAPALQDKRAIKVRVLKHPLTQKTTNILVGRFGLVKGYCGSILVPSGGDLVPVLAGS